MPKFNEKEFEAKSDLNTLREAGEIKKDSKRMKAVKVMAKKEQEALKGVITGDMIKKANKKK